MEQMVSKISIIESFGSSNEMPSRELTLSVVCAIQYRLDEDGEPEEKPFGVIPIAGQYPTTNGGKLDVQYTRLKTSSSHSDSQQEGLRMEMHGGKYEKRKQKAVIELLCSKNGDGATERRDEDEGSGDEKTTLKESVDDGQGGRIKLISYEDVEGVDVLRLQWNTKYACENIESENPKESGGWGFFSWFFFMYVQTDFSLCLSPSADISLF